MLTTAIANINPESWLMRNSDDVPSHILNEVITNGYAIHTNYYGRKYKVLVPTQLGLTTVAHNLKYLKKVKIFSLFS